MVQRQEGRGGRRFYTSLVPNSEVTDVVHAGGSVKVVTFTLDGQRFIGLDGGHKFTFTSAISV